MENIKRGAVVGAIATDIFLANKADRYFRANPETLDDNWTVIDSLHDMFLANPLEYTALFAAFSVIGAAMGGSAGALIDAFFPPRRPN